MNGRKARMFRGMAAVKADKNNKAQYEVVEHTKRERGMYDTQTDEYGNISRVLKGTFVTCTFVLGAGSRMLYQQLKRNYNQAIRG